MLKKELSDGGLVLMYPGIHGDGEIYLDVLRAICGDTSDKSMLDLMCHKAPYTSQLGFRDRTYVDMSDRGLDNIEEQQYFVKSDVFAFLVDNTSRQWDVIICSDGIEHLVKQAGHDLIFSLQFISDKHIIFTPTFDKNIDPKSDDPDVHKSSWRTRDLESSHAIIYFPDFHPTLNQGAFFAFKCGRIIDEFERVKNELKNKSWAKKLSM